MSEQLIATPSVFGDNGNFLLEREIGTGGMGGVYLGRDKLLDRPVAVKVLQKELGADEAFVEKFKKEAQSAARLVHPNIVQVYSYGICDSMPYMAMELAAGGSLFTMMGANPGKTDIQRVLKICQQIALALQCASDQGVVHGDVKPENILFDANGNAKLVDFGLAAMQKDTSEIWGTPYYISPEKVRKEPIDFRSDMYSLGATLYHALTGAAPFEGEDSVAVVKKRFEGMPKKPSEIRPEITPAIDKLVMTMLAVDKDARYPSFEALLQAFNDVLTSGLTQKMDRPSMSTPAKKAGAPNGKRLTVRRPRVTATSAAAKVSDAEPEQDEDEGGSLGMKVALFVIIGILTIGGIGGGLIWFIYASAKADEEARQREITSKITQAREVISDYRQKTLEFSNQVSSFVDRSVAGCEKVTNELKELLPDFADELKPAISDDLRKAIALTNTVETVEAPKAGGEAKASEAKPVATADKPAPRKLTMRDEAKKYGIEPPPEDLDPASPEGEEFMKKLTEARQKAAAEAAARKNATAGGSAAAASDQASADTKEKKRPEVIKDIHQLWERVYGAQASRIRIGLMVTEIIAECDKAAKIQDGTEEAMRALGDLSLLVKDKYDTMKASKDVDTVSKVNSFIEQKGKKTVENTVRRLKIEEAERKREEEKRLRAEAERLRLEKLAAEKKALIEQETSEIAQKFDLIAAQGCFRQLDWNSAYRQLKATSEYYKTAEGEIATKKQMQKVDQMKKVQDILIAKLKNYTFRNQKMKNVRVINVDEKEIQFEKPDKKKQKVLWSKFYKDYPGSFNELINHFILRGRQNSGLNLGEWKDAMTGAALTMRLVCSEVNGAEERAKKLAQEVVKQAPDYEKVMKEVFPDIDFEEALKAAEEE